ncbi:DUF4339 domain-containing protein [Roseateles sp. BYS96W]|uniref:DUF4339 domain-containing protein n=1 Tax=Pelomonas nitida TaxID=3299027 RepID=A0ABW7G1Z3_9BURK
MTTPVPLDPAAWYYERSRQQHGPHIEEEMRALVANGTLALGSRVWREGLDDWTPVEDTALGAHLKATTPPPLVGARGNQGTASRSASSDAQPPLLSGRSDAPLPAGVKGWCWGGILLNWIWAARFRVWWGLLALVPVIGIPVSIWLGVKGRELAWRRGSWASVQAFNDVQRRWSIAGAMVTLLACLLFGGSFAYEQWQAHQADAAGSDLSPEQMTRVLSEPVDLRKLGVPAPEQAAPAVHGEVDISDTMPRRIETVHGVLEQRELPDRSSAIFLGEQRLFEGPDATWHELVRKFQRADGSEAVLLRSSGGRGNSCEALYFFVVVHRDGIRFSPEFGSCTPAVRYEQRGDVITLTMPRMGGMSVYQFGNDNQVLEDGKTVEMRDGVNPTK